MTQDRRPRSEQHIAMEAAARAGPETQALLVGPLIAVCCQATSLLPCSPPGTAIALAPSELVGVAETGRAPVGDAIAGHTVI